MKRKKQNRLTIFAAVLCILVLGVLAGSIGYYYFPPRYVSPYASDTCVYTRDLHWRCERPDGTRYWRVDR